MKKICTKCKENKDLGEYSKHASGKDGKRSYCKSCANEYYANDRQKFLEYHKNRQKVWIPILKEIYGIIACTECGYSKCLAALEFHHRKSEIKKFEICRILRSKVTDERIKEIKKCDILCANCHRELHNGY